MDSASKNIFDKIEQKSNLSIDEIYRIANSIQHADFSDEATVREIVRNLSQATNRPISQQKEDKIIDSIINNDMPSDMGALQRFFE